MVVSFGEVVDHLDDEVSGISDARGKHPDDEAFGMSSAQGEYPGDEASGIRGAPGIPGPAGFWAWSHEGPWVGRMANGTGPGPMIPTMPPFFLPRGSDRPRLEKRTSLTVASLGIVDNQCCSM